MKGYVVQVNDVPPIYQRGYFPRSFRYKRDTIVHYAPEVEGDKAKPLFNKKSSDPLPYCQRAKAKRPVSYRFYTNFRNVTRVASNPDKVTCKTCRKAMAKLPHPKAPALAAATPNAIVADWLDEHGQPELAHALRHPSDCKCEPCKQQREQVNEEILQTVDPVGE